MGQAQRGPYENNRGLIFPTMAQASKLSKFLIIWQSEQTCYFEFVCFCELKYTAHDHFHGNG